MKNKRVIISIALHFLTSLGAFLWLNTWAIGSQDSGVPAPGIDWLAALVHFFLLQPLAHWVLMLTQMVWWTAGGLSALAALFAVNSVLAVGMLAWVWRQAGAWRSAA